MPIKPTMISAHEPRIIRNALVFLALIVGVSTSFAVEIVKVEPTPLFPKPAGGLSLKQIARVHLDPRGLPVGACKARLTLGTRPPEIQDLGTLAMGKSVVDILIPDITAPKPLKIELMAAGGNVFAAKQVAWQPQKKWTIYQCSFSHQDHGYGDYPHRLRTSIRHKNIELPLKYCAQSDSWPDASKYRYNIETSEAITSFISFHGKDAGRELARRMREGRMVLGGLHNTVNSEQLSHELMARIFYLSGRHTVDLLGVTASQTLINNDIVGLTWPLATYAREADFKYCYHGFNGGCMPGTGAIKSSTILGENPGAGGAGRCVFAPANEPNFLWQGPDGSRILRNATPYGSRIIPAVENPTTVERALRGFEAMHWPYASLLSSDGFDFEQAELKPAQLARKWNDAYVYPKFRSATFDDYFRAIQSEMTARKITPGVIAADENNQWSDQEYADAQPMGAARRLSESWPATETLATVGQVLSGGGDTWLERFQGYHRLLTYYEHTNASSQAATRDNRSIWRETEREENREMVHEASDYQQRVFQTASQRLTTAISRGGERNLIVFNPLPQARTDVVRMVIPAARVVDEAGHESVVQQLPDGTAIFVATDVPATGYTTYSLMGEPGPIATAGDQLESQFYRICFNPRTGALTSWFDKTLGVDLIESGAPHGFNEYLYEFRTVTKAPAFDSVWSRIEKADAVVVTRGPVADILTVTGKARGVLSMKQTVLLYHDLPRVDFSIWLDKARFEGKFNLQKEAVFVALPFNIADFKIHHELPGAVVEPYRQQVGGSATDHYAIRGFTDISNEKFGVTVSPIEGSLVCYGAPISSPISTHVFNFRRDQTYPDKSRLYLYLMNNMFSTNISPDQQGPVEFRWALTSHAGNWQSGGAAQFGRAVHQPLMAWRADGKLKGSLPRSASFMSVDAPNVTCSVIKPSEANGRGVIIRLNETTGKETTVTVSLPLMAGVESVKETSLVETDRREIGKGNRIQVKLPKFGVKTLRVICTAHAVRVSNLKAEAVADMQVDLRWRADGPASYFNIYRDTQPDCAATQLNFIGQSANGRFSDYPRVNLGGWLRSCLTPKTPYYYRIVPVDRSNNPGPPSDVVRVSTPDQPNLPPVAVEGLRAILISPITMDNQVNLLFRTACEADVRAYEIFRDGTLLGTLASDSKVPWGGGYPISKILYTVRDYDHATFLDPNVAPGTTYTYQVRAVDNTGQKGAFSAEATVRTK